MSFRLLFAVVVGAIVFSFPAFHQLLMLSGAPAYWIALAIAVTGLTAFVRGAKKKGWSIPAKPWKRTDSLWLAACLIMGIAGLYFDYPSISLIFGIAYFGTVAAHGLSVNQYKIIRPYGALLFLFAAPIENASALFSFYQQNVIKLATLMLDAFQIRHVADVDQIDGFNATIQWADVASSIWSAYAILAVTAYGIAKLQLRWIHGICLFPLAIIISTIMLATRFAIALATDGQGNMAFINVGTFLVSLYFLWAGQSLIRFVLDPIRGGTFSSKFVPRWNRTTTVGYAQMQLRQERESITDAEIESCRLPTIDAIIEAEDRRSRDIRRHFRRFARSINRSIIHGFIFINDWCWSRRLSRFLPIIPIAIAIAVVGLLPNLHPRLRQSAADLSKQYAIDLDKSRIAGDSARIDVLSRRLQQFPELSDPVYFSLAKGLVAIDRTEDADLIIDDLINEELNPYPPAQLWQAKRLLNTTTNLSVEQRNKIKDYLRKAASVPALASDANWQLGQMFIQENDDENAIRFMRLIPRPLPEASILLAILYKKRGDSIAYLRCLKDAETACREKLASDDDADKLKMRLLLARSLQMQERFDESIKVLEAAPDFATNTVLRRAAIVVDIAWFHKLDDSQDKERAKRLDHAISIDANEPLLQNLLATVAVDEKNDSKESVRQRAIKAVTAAQEADDLTATSLSILGTKAAELGKYDAAEKQLRESVDAGNQSPSVLNNLAWVLAQKPDSQGYEEALELINRALRSTPQVSELWKTRAEIWERLGDPLEAIADLEKAIQLGDKSSEVRQKLSVLYAAEGDLESSLKYQDQK